MQLMGPMAQCLDHLLIKKSRYTYSTHTRNARGYRFYFPENMFDGPTYNRDNWCFCPKNVDQEKCHGILDLSSCLTGIPFALTFPHFLNSDQFLNSVSGLNPSKEKHLGFLNIEPVSLDNED
jgi:hypothetical protein